MMNDLRKTPQLSTQSVLVLLCFINLINYVDRGIIPGAPQSFQLFLTETLHVDVTQQGSYLGLLVTAFIASDSIGSLVFGHLTLSYRPFQLVAFGMSVWIIAVVLCGLAYTFNSYYLLLIGRVLSGVGEASFHCNAMPFINRHAPEGKSALWMGLFITSLTVGMALGYVYGALLAGSSLTWAGAFFLEAGVMVVPVLCCMFCIPEELNQIPRDGHSLDHDSKDEATLVTANGGGGMVRAWWELLREPVFMLVVFGHTAYNFTIAAFSVFCPIILIGLGMFDDQSAASIAFGAIVVVSGTLGTILGGVGLDVLSVRCGAVSSADRFDLAMQMLFYLMTAGTLTAIVMMQFTADTVAFLALLAVTFFILSMTGPAELLAVMELFPPSRHALAIAINTVFILVLADIPGPVVVGLLQDAWAPRCGTVEVDGVGVLNPECPRDRSGLSKVLLVPVLWMLWAVLGWGVALWLQRRKRQSECNQSELEENLLQS